MLVSTSPRLRGPRVSIPDNRHTAEARCKFPSIGSRKIWKILWVITGGVAGSTRQGGQRIQNNNECSNHLPVFHTVLLHRRRTGSVEYGLQSKVSGRLSGTKRYLFVHPFFTLFLIFFIFLATPRIPWHAATFCVRPFLTKTRTNKKVPFCYTVSIGN